MKNSLPTKAKWAVELATEKGSSNWLSMIPLFRFLFHTPYWEPRIVLETVLPLCCFFLDLQFPLHKLFSEKNCPRITPSDLYLYTSHFQKKNKTEKLTSKGSARWQRHNCIVVLSRFPHPTKASLPWVLLNARLLCCLIMLKAYLLEQ